MTRAATSFNPLVVASDPEAGGVERRRGKSYAKAVRQASAGLLALFAVLLALAPPNPARAEVANPYGVAVIIGNADYEHRDVPDVTFAHRDADAFRAYVVEVLGFDPENVIDLRDATRRELFDALGTKRDPRSLLWSYLDPDGGSDVVVFYSGHGVPGVNDGRGYLLPVDADPKAAEDDGYPIDLLYRNVAGLAESGSVRVYLDACFSGGSHEGGLIRDASPVFVEAALPDGVGDKVTSLTAASGKQVASWDEDARHGLFTHHLLDALYGGGDADGDGKVTAAEAKRYLDRHMTRAARRQHRRIQTASLVGVKDAVLAAAVGGAFPGRPGSEPDAEPVPAPLARDDGREEEIAAATAAPSPLAENAESKERALGLTYEQRVLVQQGLNSLDEDVGRADGVFGRRTRAGILSYQKKKGLPETGYLTGEQAEGLMGLGKEGREEARRAEETPAGRMYTNRLDSIAGLDTHGFPAPMISTVAGRMGLDPNGDGCYASGVVFDVAEAVFPITAGLEFEVDFYMNTGRFFHHGISLRMIATDYRPDAASVGADGCSDPRDMRPDGSYYRLLDLVHHSATDRMRMSPQFVAGTTDANSVEYDQDGWNRLRMQILSDRRVRIWLNGRELGTVEHARAQSGYGSEGYIWIEGRSARDPVLVDNLEVSGGPVEETPTRALASYGKFHVIAHELSEDQDHGAECRSQLGNGFRLADWNDIVSYYEGGGSLTEFIAGLGMSVEGRDRLPGEINSGYRISSNGRPIWSGNRPQGRSRHYFFARHDHRSPGYFLAHANVDNYHLSLGSWYGTGGHALCYRLGG